MKGFRGDQTVKNLPTMGETWIWSLGWEDPLEKEMATHFSILARLEPQLLGLELVFASLDSHFPPNIFHFITGKIIEGFSKNN